jgi:tetratricopeptide (TPR) repeat protein
LYKEAGELVRAGEVFLLADRLDEAAACMRAAGRTREAARIGGRYFEKRGQWKEAAQAYLSAEEHLRAADCFTKAGEMVRAAECFERAGEFYRGAVAYARAARFEDAIRLCQKVREDDPLWDQSRALLGRSFYEMHDYAHCAAALDNFLMGKRVASDNIEYFYMLALAQEQLGRLDESRELLYKIRTVQTGFRDVAQRISNISSRISMQQGGAPYEPATPGAGNPQMMQMVENNLGSRYHLERELGRGGMGVVYLARDKQLDRLVALKFLGSLVDDSEEYRQRFIREAKAAAKVNHPNIISIYDISASVGKAYIAMEYVEGPNLYKYMASKPEGKLAPREAVNIVTQACAALHAIHQVGVTHRDLKPDNILLAKGGLVKLTDFGLAKAEDARITQSNMIMGTPCYMSPEQARGQEADARSDVYAMGLVLHEALTGQVVFRDGDVLMRQQVETPPPPSAKVAEIAPGLDAIVMKCIKKQPEARFQSAKELQHALRQLSL